MSYVYFNPNPSELSVGDCVGYDCPLSRPKSSYFGHKYVYIYDTHIKGHADNVATGTANNVPYANNKWVLRYVFGC